MISMLNNGGVISSTSAVLPVLFGNFQILWAFYRLCLASTGHRENSLADFNDSAFIASGHA